MKRSGIELSMAVQKQVKLQTLDSTGTAALRCVNWFYFGSIKMQFTGSARPFIEMISKENRYNFINVDMDFQ